jgi:hypothetical protein
MFYLTAILSCQSAFFLVVDSNYILILFLTIGGIPGMKGSPAFSKGESLNISLYHM